MWSEVFDRLPDNYSKMDQINNKKIHQIVYEELEEARDVFKDIRKAHSIETSTGMSLDFIGGNVMQKRKPGESDESLRLMIKVKIISNLSQGDIGTINEVASILLGDNLISVRETWNLSDFDNEPAGLVLDLIPGINYIPSDVISRTVAGGVGIVIILTLKQPQAEIFVGATTIGGASTLVIPHIETKGKVENKTSIAMGMIGSDESVVHPYYTKRLDSRCMTYIAIGNNTDIEKVTIYPRKEVI